ncbi:eukaryotic translation initiation factor 3 subunit M-like [Acropora muricata]|uniref:eukaryotic translation initiation factor 3 subunit M-like n=1 Tax=Acropora muricata TaxID=159855 RepID=UPI0034E54EE8
MAKYANYFQLVVLDLETEFRDESHIKNGLTKMLVKEVLRILSVDQKRFGLHFNCDSIPARNESRASYSDENALEVKDDAKNCIVSLLGQPNVFVLDFLLTLPPVAALQGEVIHELLNIFVSGRLSDYVEFYEKNKDFVDSCDMFLLSMITMILSRQESGRGKKGGKKHYEKFDCSNERAVKIFTSFVKVVQTYLFFHYICCCSSAIHRTFGANQWQELRNHLEDWRQSLTSVRNSMHSVVPRVDA